MLHHGPSLLRLALPAIPDSLQVCDELNLGIDGAPAQQKHLSIRKPLIGAATAALFYELTGSEFGIEQARRIGARATSAVWIADHIIDDFGFQPATKVAILRKLSDSIESGRRHSFPESERLEHVSLMLSHVNRLVSGAPNPDAFIGTFVELAQAAIKQITLPPCIDTAMEVGGLSSKLIASIPFCWKRDCDELLRAAVALGGYLQIFDDLLDREHDLKHDIRTFATIEENQAVLFDSALEQAQKKIDEAYAVLPKSQHWALDLLLQGALCGSKQLRTFRHIAPLPRTRWAGS
ncbi:MAG: hypothetical protein J0M12_14025 [Deltaproteobacteria bacterium]|nr:hypothetical protein [Deltaproteobacteria bacterium]